MQATECFALRGGCWFFEELIREEREIALRRDRGVFLPKGSCSGVARIRIERKVCGGSFSVQRSKRGLRHVDLTAYLAGDRLLERCRDCPNRAHVRRDIFTRGAVSTRCGTHEGAAFVDEADRESIDLQFSNELRLTSTEPLRRAGSKVGDFFGRKGVGEAQHRALVTNLGQLYRRLHAIVCTRPNTLRR